MTLFFIAGEKSGDLHASQIIRQIKVAQPNVQIYGWGGEAMKKDGTTILQTQDAFGVMGFSAILGKLFQFKSLLRTCKRQLLELRPEVVILVDFSGFNMRVARIAKKLGIKVCYYIPPKTWAWGAWRLSGLRKLTDEVLCIFPFEESYFRKHQVKAHFIGNPTFEQLEHIYPVKEESLPSSPLPIAVLPGSRIQEVKTCVPVIAGLARKYPNYQFKLAAVSHLGAAAYSPVSEIPNVQLKWDDSTEVLRHSRAAVVNSGTATLEAALLGIPQIVIYQTSWVNYYLAKWMLQITYISLVNILLNEKVVSECIQGQCNVEVVAQELDELLHCEKRQKKISEGYSEIRKMLAGKQASKEAAERILALCRS
ncbi:lipid-A-disaccharide synthase [Marinoscillum furvescens]|uniref:Lipid-A-disaccharide synthase n=1 Tax=Marinoscillum furvescens DSM 4134 TaxID=1122208 RepID=A0A3D9KXJ5_MARFU|nr:lipid-A-disaccharide synthase [Marinoscillum furvescens]RED92622.1 lipid-A-disaccharide synthase [Marinoscillum furvescens DSM 4134]